MAVTHVKRGHRNEWKWYFSETGTSGIKYILNGQCKRQLGCPEAQTDGKKMCIKRAVSYEDRVAVKRKYVNITLLHSERPKIAFNFWPS